MGSEREVEHKKRTEVVGEMEQIRSPVATMLQIEYRRMKSELEVERKKRIDVLEIIKKHIKVVEEIKSKHIVVVEEIKSKHNAQMKQIQSMICISTNNSDNSKSRTKKIGINKDKMNELKGIMETITTPPCKKSALWMQVPRKRM